VALEQEAFKFHFGSLSSAIRNFRTAASD